MEHFFNCTFNGFLHILTVHTTSTGILHTHIWLSTLKFLINFFIFVFFERFQVQPLWMRPQKIEITKSNAFVHSIFYGRIILPKSAQYFMKIIKMVNAYSPNIQICGCYQHWYVRCKQNLTENYCASKWTAINQGLN